MSNSARHRGSKGPGSSPDRAQQLRFARRRALTAKACLAVLGGAVFGAGMVFAPRSFAGHPKTPIRALEAPQRFVEVVKRDLLQAGVIGPAQAPPDAATSVS